MSHVSFLVGPMVRRASPSAVTIFVATPSDVALCAELFLVDVQATMRARQRGGRAGPPRASATNLAKGTQERWRLGPGMTAHLLTLVPANGSAFPTGAVLAYDVRLDPDGASLRSHPEQADFVLPPFDLPTFVLQAPRTALLALQGSCRKLHGGARDAMVAADRELTRLATDAQRRPTTLFLTGDQIYADDVASPVMQCIRPLAATLRGGVDRLPDARLEGLALGDRQRAAKDACGFTSGEAGNHLFSFGEYAAMYALSWNPRVWPATIPPPAAADQPKEGREKFAEKYRKEKEAIDEQRPRIVSARRVLANISSFMMWDDHEVTDDWFLNTKWRSTVRAQPAGRRVIANGIAAFAVFQAWGNTPERFASGAGAALRQAIESALKDGPVPVGGAGFDTAAWDHAEWAFAVPTFPMAYVLDSRTRRESTKPAPPGDAPRLMDDTAWGALRSSCAPAAGKPLVVVSPAPIFGFTPVESILGLAMRAAERLAAEATTLRLIADEIDALLPLLRDAIVRKVGATLASLLAATTQLLDRLVAAVADLAAAVAVFGGAVDVAVRQLEVAVVALVEEVTAEAQRALAAALALASPGVRALVQDLLDLQAPTSPSRIVRVVRVLVTLASRALVAGVTERAEAIRIAAGTAVATARQLSVGVAARVVPAIDAVVAQLGAATGAARRVAAALPGLPGKLASAIDFESWDANPRNYFDLHAALDAVRPSVCAILSGDVHYANAAAVRWKASARRGEHRVAQLTASATNNSPGKLGLALKALSLDSQLLMGGPATAALWDGPPVRVEASDVAAEQARRGRPPELVEVRRFETGLLSNLGPVITDANMGLLAVSPGGVVAHAHLIDEGGRTRRALELSWDVRRWPV